MTNKEWLDYLAQNAPDELAAWFDAEHVETEERALDGDASALNAKIAALEKKLRISWEYECKFQDERDVLQAQVDELTAERELHREALGQLIDAITEGMGKVSALLDSYDEGMA